MFHLRWSGLRCELFQHGGEFEFVEKFATGSRIRFERAHGFKFKLHRYFAMDGHQFLAEQDGLAIILQRLAIGLALHFIGMIERRLHAAELLDQLNRSLVTDPGRAGDIVDGVAAQSHYIDYLFWWHAECFKHLVAIEDQIVFHRIQHFYVIIHQLQHVLVAGDDKHRVTCIRSLFCECADDVIGFKSVCLEDRNMKGFERPPNVGQLLREVWRHLGTVGLVAAIVGLFKALCLGAPLAQNGDLLGAFIAKNGSAGIENGCEKDWSKVAPQFVDHVHENISRRCRHAVACGHGALPLHRVIRAEDEGHRVEQVNGLLIRTCRHMRPLQKL